jgi:hypothetical protein
MVLPSVAAATALLGGVTLDPGNVDIFTVAIDHDTVNEEIVYVTGVSGDTLTISRGQAGTGTPGVSGIAHNAGASVKHVLTSSDLIYFRNSASPVSSFGFTGSTSGTTTVQASAVAGTTTLTLPAATDTLVGKATTDTLTNKTIDTATNTITGAVTLTGTQTLTNKTVTDPVMVETVNAQTGTTYTPVLSDAKQMVTLNNASAITVTIPPASSVAYTAGSKIDFIAKGAGQVSFAQGSGVTIRSTGATATAPKLRVQYSAATAWYEGSDVWYIVGDLA